MITVRRLKDLLNQVDNRATVHASEPGIVITIEPAHHRMRSAPPREFRGKPIVHLFIRATDKPEIDDYTSGFDDDAKDVFIDNAAATVDWRDINDAKKAEYRNALLLLIGEISHGGTGYCIKLSRELSERGYHIGGLRVAALLEELATAKLIRKFRHYDRAWNAWEITETGRTEAIWICPIQT